jgi:hypothetical protein
MNMNRTFALVLVLAVATAAIMPAGAVASDRATTVDTKRADLTIIQPHYIGGSVEAKQGGNETVYQASGRELTIVPENFDAADVVSVDVKENEGSISYAPDRGVFVFDTGGVEGSYTITWVVNEQVQKDVVENDTTKTVNESVTNTYSAVLSVDKVDLAHVSNSQLDGLRSDAENWSETADLYGSVGNPNKPIEKKLQLGARLVEAWNNPIEALQGDFGIAVQSVFLTAGGLILFILWNIPHLVRSRRLRKENKELKEKIGDYEAIDEALDEIFTERRKQYLREKSFNDWFDDRTAAWLRRNLAPDPWAGFRKLAAMLSPEHLNGIVAGAMLDSGRFVAIIEREHGDEDVATDGGDPATPAGGSDAEQVSDEDRDEQHADDAPEADVVTARMYRADGDLGGLELEPHESVVSDSDDLTADVTEKIDPGTLDSEVLRNGDVELRSVALPVSNTADQDDLVERLNVSIPEDFETREHFATVLETLIKKVAASDFSNAEGEVEPERDLANFLMAFSTIYGESYDQAYLRYMRDLMLHNLDRLDASERTRNVVEEARDRTDQGAGS